jgi:hypothetical protein
MQDWFTISPLRCREKLREAQPECLLMLDRPLSTVADIVSSDGVAFDGKQDAKDTTAAAINHLSKCDAWLLGLILGNRTKTPTSVAACCRKAQRTGTALCPATEDGTKGAISFASGDDTLG